VPALEAVKGHPMAKAAIELAVLDAELRTAGQSLADRLGGVVDRVPSGVSVGIMDSVPELLDAVGAYLDQGYVRIKLKIEPGWDLEPVRAVRERFGDVPLQVDANTAYRLSDARHLARLDEFDLLLVEQPLPEDDVRGHAELARQVRTPVCLDESVTSARSAADAISLGACSVINVKAGRVGGYLEAVKVHDVAAAHGIPSGAAGWSRPASAGPRTSPSRRCPASCCRATRAAPTASHAQDLITTPFVLEDGHVAVPTGPGLGVDVDPDVLAETVVRRRTVVL
jgi:O-succinylbenzoate synthase